ncbi:gamma-tubulin complex component 3 homolog isoform X2 [Dysidea avara]|uniref:gamma-tubulin complex component 3 homolog isoform X2 n=1 Tax=Dysidea avara TaxID=196820 RepID=UPI003320097D
MAAQQQRVFDLLNGLCDSYTHGKGDTARIFKFCAGILSRYDLHLNQTSFVFQREYRRDVSHGWVIQNMCSMLRIWCDKFIACMAKQGREKDAVLFAELHRRLSSQGVWHNTWAILHLLLVLADENTTSPAHSMTSLLLETPGLPSDITMATARSYDQRSVASKTFTSSGIGSQTSLSSGLQQSQQTESTLLATPLPNFASTPATQPHRPVKGAWLQPATHPVKPAQKETDYGDVSEADLVRDLLYVFQGIDGHIIRYDASSDHYLIDKKVSVSASIKELCHKLAELGWLFHKVKQYVEARSRDKAFGLVGQGFCAALSKEVAEYYRLIAVLEGQPVHSDVSPRSGALTLRRLVVWTYDPLDRLKLLATLISNCEGLKGGALVSTLYTFTQHGDPQVRRLVKQLLNQAYQPLNAMLNSWIFDGELHDHYHEFFVAGDPRVPRERLWQEEYSLHREMLPSFIPYRLAQKILLIGKSINFLRLRCHDRSQPGDQSLRNWFRTKHGDLKSFDDMIGPALHQTVDTVYRETSKLLLQILDSRYKFREHLHALRRYLLLGQGDFIRYLMDQLESELIKPATELFRHNLTGTLEASVRATNAQYDDADILQRLDVRILELSPGDSGWDVFSLDYHVDGPISTVFTQEVMLQYLRVFNFLWRAKRMEHCLTNMWRNQAAYYAVVEQIPELLPVFHQVHLLTSSMVHFIGQMQYYITFEVLECCWADLLQDIESAPDLDHLITTHSSFLRLITTRCLLDPKSQTLLTQLRAIFDIIVESQAKQSRMYTECLQEVELRQQYSSAGDTRTKQGSWGITGTEADAEYERRALFVRKSVASYRSQFTVLQRNYQDMVEEFISQLKVHVDQSLRFLSSRLDFNEHYKMLAEKKSSDKPFSKKKSSKK